MIENNSKDSVNQNYDFTIITPCYNGSEFLISLHQNIIYESRNYKVEWILIDDCSNDNGLTKSKILEVEKIGGIPIKSIFLDKNYFASRSVAVALKEASAPFTIILDQDDLLAHHSLDYFSKYIPKYSGLVEFAGVCARCKDLNGDLIGSEVGEYEKYERESYIRHRLKINGEMLQCTKTNILKKYFTMMRPGHMNGYIWNKIGRDYRFVFVSDVVRIYNTENINSVSKIKKLNWVEPQCEQISEYFVDNYTDLIFDWKSMLISVVHFSRLTIHLGSLIYFKRLPIVFKILVIFFSPVGFLKVIKDRLDGRI